jgi:hypothetical protein
MACYAGAGARRWRRAPALAAGTTYIIIYVAFTKQNQSQLFVYLTDGGWKKCEPGAPGLQERGWRDAGS